MSVDGGTSVYINIHGSLGYPISRPVKKAWLWPNEKPAGLQYSSKIHKWRRYCEGPSNGIHNLQETLIPNLGFFGYLISRPKDSLSTPISHYFLCIMKHKTTVSTNFTYSNQQEIKSSMIKRNGKRLTNSTSWSLSSDGPVESGRRFYNYLIYPLGLSRPLDWGLITHNNHLLKHSTTTSIFETNSIMFTGTTGKRNKNKDQRSKSNSPPTHRRYLWYPAYRRLPSTAKRRVFADESSSWKLNLLSSAPINSRSLID